MNLWILSDLHQDHGRFDLEVPPEADIAIIAGDVVNDEFLADMARRLPTVFVAGNHEFYNWDYQERIASLSAVPGLHFLNDDMIEIDGVRIVGATLWTDYGRNPACADAARRMMNDHRRIKWKKEPYERFLPSHATRLHERSSTFLSGVQGHAEVVVTHHAPSAKSVHPKYAEGPYAILNRAYYSDLDGVVADSGAKIWIHGHTHSSFDYEIGDTRVICNPHGYPGENPAFDPALLVEV